jgi:Ca2+-binding RTX toxin-like protein
MSGGAGNDTFVVNTTSDVVTENAGEGTDTVQSSVTWTLKSNLENATLTGSTAINAIGNTLDNVLTGNGGSNTLTGNDGNDTLNAPRVRIVVTWIGTDNPGATVRRGSGSIRQAIQRPSGGAAAAAGECGARDRLSGSGCHGADAGAVA